MALGLLLAASLLATKASAAAPVLVVSRGPCELLKALKVLGVEATLRSELLPTDELSGGRFQAVALCSLDYPQPTRLALEQVEALERFAASGGRAYVEFAVPDSGGTLFGLSAPPKPRRALDQRLYANQDLGPLAGLRAGDILEEHNSACLVPADLPPNASPWLTYGLLMGTYQVMPADRAFTVTVDLGEARTLRSASQRFGAGQPDYHPERVELWLGNDPSRMRRAAVRERAPLGPVVRFDLDAPQARYVRLVSEKHRRSPVTDFLFTGEVEVLDQTGRNVALHRPYTLSPGPSAGTYGDSGGELTDGVPDGPYSDGRSVGWVTQPAERWQEWPALVEVPFGQGTALVALTKLSDFRAREYRLTRRCEGLARWIALQLVAPEEREAAARRYVPLDCRTDPPVWAPPDTPVTLTVRTSAEATVAAALDGRDTIALKPEEAGLFGGRLAPREGEHEVHVVAWTDNGRAERTLRLRVSSRETAYRRALDRNMAWFERSGVLPRPDGSAGVWSQRCLAWFGGGPTEFLGSPFRVDCNAATAQVAQLYAQVTGDDAWRSIAANIARSMLPHQYADPSRSCFGAWPWLYENSDAVFFWDDNTRVAVALLWLYTQTEDESLLRAGLRTMELCREVAQEDGTIARHCITAPQLDVIGRAGFRALPPQGLAVDFDLKRWAWAYGVTGDPAYRDLLLRLADVWGPRAGARGLPWAVRFADRPELRDRLSSLWAGVLRDPDVLRYGAPRAGGGDYERAYVGDCSITTTADDPLTDQLYVTPHLLLQAWWGHRTTGDPACLEAFHAVGDYLVRIQFESADPRIDGAWMRGFDFESWEYYGAPYDPAYGPYSAYTGWMNAFTSTAFAQYLLDADPLPPLPEDNDRAAALLAEVRAQRPVAPRPTNLARGAGYALSPTPDPSYQDAGGELTDGVLDGGYEDGRSVGWHLADDTEARVEFLLDLGSARAISAVSQRYGAGQPGYCPDRVEVSAGPDREHLTRVAAVTNDGAGPGARFIALDSPVSARYLRFALAKRRVSAVTDFLFVGETEAFETP